MPELSILPQAWRVNYLSAAVEAKKSWTTFILWECITPGYTAVFLLLTGAWYYYKSLKSKTEDAKAAFHETALAFSLWGAFNTLVYIMLEFIQRRQAV